MLSNVIFYSVAFAIILFAFMTLSFRNIFYSLLSAMMLFLFTSVVFYMLGSEYNAIIQFAVYGLAVPVIIGIAIMFTGSGTVSVSGNKVCTKKSVFLLFATLFILSFVYLVLTSYAIVPEGFNIISDFNLSHFDNIKMLSKSIFIRYVFAFELISLVLTIAVVGLTMFKRGKNA